MNRRVGSWKRVDRGLLVVLGIVAVTGVVNLLVVNQRAFLNFYYLPVLVGAWMLGRARGVSAALLSCAIVFALALADHHNFGGPDPERWMRWLDLSTWACFLVLTAYVVGSLYEARTAQLRDLRQAYAGILEILGKFIDSVDRHTENHSRRVSDLAVQLAQALDLPDNEVEDIRVGALLHDIGKIDVSTEVLRKAARLTPEEFAEMQTHVEKGEALVRSVGGVLRHALPLIACHHERWDGTGYKGLRGEQIPLGARIIAIADTYDAIVTTRSYREARSHTEALEVIRSESGRQFDPEVVAVFLDAFADASIEDREAA